MSPITCPTCGRQHPVTERFCECGYPLYVENSASSDPTASHNPARLPGESDQIPVAAPVDKTTPAVQPRIQHDVGPSILCPTGHPNEPNRTLCSVCGLQLGGATAPPPAPPPVFQPQRTVESSKILIAALAAVTVIVIGGATWALFRSPGDETDDGGGAQPEISTDRTVVPVPSGTVSASASSVLPDQDNLSYSATNTLDGDLATAWNNDSIRTGNGEGETLTYTFSGTIDLARIELVNGYAKDDNVFASNSSIAQVEIITDQQTITVDLFDIMDPQTIEQALGPTSSVTLRVKAIHPGAGFQDSALTTDLALTEISFFQFSG